MIETEHNMIARKINLNILLSIKIFPVKIIQIQNMNMLLQTWNLNKNCDF